MLRGWFDRLTINKDEANFISRTSSFRREGKFCLFSIKLNIVSFSLIEGCEKGKNQKKEI
ncbi:MAG: hypothetical protein A3B08_00285 [Candidatus Taylorbacteria bacterium RIFCSPLOWO2_01_FULL_43_44]|nr:MAG: hypothetical protein A3B08_00285 [Candidatus Taylorbacteria bacterium RIFCSPLOWO2_01_FULL_43_44]